MKPVLVTTEYRGVFFGYVEEYPNLDESTTISLKHARMAVYWATNKGVMQLASEGVQKNSLVSSIADIPSLAKVTAVFRVSEEAEETWKAA